MSRKPNPQTVLVTAVTDAVKSRPIWTLLALFIVFLVIVAGTGLVLALSLLRGRF